MKILMVDGKPYAYPDETRSAVMYRCESPLVDENRGTIIYCITKEIRTDFIETDKDI